MQSSTHARENFVTYLRLRCRARRNGPDHVLECTSSLAKQRGAHFQFIRRYCRSVRRGKRPRTCSCGTCPRAGTADGACLARLSALNNLPNGSAFVRCAQRYVIRQMAPRVHGVLPFTQLTWGGRDGAGTLGWFCIGRGGTAAPS